MMQEQDPEILATREPPSALVRMPMPAEPVVYKRYISNQSIAIGIFQIFIGVFCIIVNIIALALHNELMNSVGHGLWCGVLFIITGRYGVAAGTSKVRCKIIAFTVLCIVSASCTAALLAVGIVGAIMSSEKADYYARRCPDEIYRQINPEDCSLNETYRASEAMEILLVILGAIQGTLAINGATIYCKSRSCCKCCCTCCVDCCEDCCCVSDPPTATSDGNLSNYGQLGYINQTQAAHYVSLPEPMTAGSLTPPPPNIPSLPQSGYWIFPLQPQATGIISAPTETTLAYTSGYNENDNTGDVLFDPGSSSI